MRKNRLKEEIFFCHDAGIGSRWRAIRAVLCGHSLRGAVDYVRLICSFLVPLRSQLVIGILAVSYVA